MCVIIIIIIIIGGHSENNINASCMTISGGRTKQLDIFCRITGFTSDFLSVSCGTYSVLSRSPSVINSSSLPRFSDKWFGRRNH